MREPYDLVIDLLPPGAPHSFELSAEESEALARLLSEASRDSEIYEVDVRRFDNA